MSTEIIEQEARPWFTEQEARRATELTRVAADRVVASVATYVERVTEDYERRADVALGYESWEAYATSELAGEASFPTEIRRTIVGQLSQIDRWASREPMSTRAIAPTVGVGKSTIERDQVSHGGPPETPSQAQIRREAVNNLASTGATQQEIANKLGVSQPTVQRDLKAIADDPPKPEPAERVTGLDGKSYPARRAAAPAQRDPSDGEPEVSIIEPATGEIHTEPSFAPGVKGKIYGPKFNQEKAIRNLTHMCEGIVFGTKNISNPTFDSEEASSITASLSAAITSLKQVIKLVKENQK